jgi:hypothetical protein
MRRRREKNSKKNSIIQWRSQRMRDTNNYFDAVEKNKNSKKLSGFSEAFA